MNRELLILGTAFASAYAFTGMEWMAYISLTSISASFDFKPRLLSALPLILAPLSPISAICLSLPHIARLSISSYRVRHVLYSVLNFYIRRPPGSYFYLRNQSERALLLNFLVDVTASSFILAMFMPNFFLLPIAPLSATLVLGLKGPSDEEIPFLPLLGWMASLSGSEGLETSIEEVTSPKAFPFLYRVKLLLFKLKTYFSYDPLTSIRELSSRFKDELGDFLESYHSVVFRGGRVSEFLKSETNEMLEEVFGRWRSRIAGISTMGEVLFIALGLLPAMISVTSFMGFGFFPLTPLPYILPPVYVMVLALTDLLLPPFDAECEIKTYISISSALFAISLLLGASSRPMLFSVALTFSLIPASIGFLRCWKRARSEDKYISILLRKVVDCLKSGSPIAEVLGKERRLAPWWARVDSGMRPTEAFEHMKWESRKAARAFYSLCVAIERGAGLEALEALHRFFRRLKSYSSRLHAEVGWVVFFALATPFISAMSLGFIAEVSGNEGLLVSSSWLLVENSALAGLLASKLASFTAKSFPILLATMAVTSASLMLFGLP